MAPVRNRLMIFMALSKDKFTGYYYRVRFKGLKKLD